MLPLRAPSWVTEWYPNDPLGLKLAIAGYFTPVTDATEREAVRAFVPIGQTFACSECGKFAFSKPQLCYWCTRR